MFRCALRGTAIAPSECQSPQSSVHSHQSTVLSTQYSAHSHKKEYHGEPTNRRQREGRERRGEERAKRERERKTKRERGPRRERIEREARV